MAAVAVLGVDAGGTATRAVVTRDGVVAGRFDEGPLNLLLHEDAFDRLVALVKRSGAEVAGLGLAGLRGADEASRLQQRLRAATGVAVEVADDTEIALLGAFGGEPGVVVIAGTGSNAFGRDAAGRAARVGGYGFLLGDEGSSYRIASEALRAALRSHDRTGPHAPRLEQTVLETYGLDFDGIVRLVHSAPADRQLIARLARVVMALDDPLVHSILDTAADDLAMMAAALRDRLGLDLPVAMHGGVFNNPRIRGRFVAATGAVAPRQAPEFGAIVLATRTLRGRDGGWRQS